jgi:hypothetical protein
MPSRCGNTSAGSQTRASRDDTLQGRKGQVYEMPASRCREASAGDALPRRQGALQEVLSA